MSCSLRLENGQALHFSAAISLDFHEAVEYPSH
jgi:hypothetical protein